MLEEYIQYDTIYINFETYMFKQKKSKDFRFKLEYLEMMS